MPKRGARKPARVEARQLRGWERRQAAGKQEERSPSLPRKALKQDAGSTAPAQQKRQQQSDTVPQEESDSGNDSEATVLHTVSDEELGDKKRAKGEWKQRIVAKDEPDEDKAVQSDQENAESALSNRGLLERAASEACCSKAASEHGVATQCPPGQAGSRVTQHLQASRSSSSSEVTEVSSHASRGTRIAPNLRRASRPGGRVTEHLQASSEVTEASSHASRGTRVAPNLRRASQPGGRVTEHLQASSEVEKESSRASRGTRVSPNLRRASQPGGRVTEHLQASEVEKEISHASCRTRAPRTGKGRDRQTREEISHASCRTWAHRTGKGRDRKTTCGSRTCLVGLG